MPRIYKKKPILDPKLCSRCNMSKPLSEFTSNPSTFDKKHSRCNKCRAELRAIARKQNPLKISKQKQISKQKHKETSYAKEKEWKQANPKRVYASNSKWRLANPGKWNAISRSYNLLKSKAMPTWVNKEIIYKIYENCPKGYQVDHIYPLKGKGFNGLHVPWNLQYLPTQINKSKGNKNPESFSIKGLDPLELIKEKL